MQKFDAVVVGGGPGGYECAIRLSQNGLNTALVEKAELGGTCLNRGCIPTKTLLHSADVYYEATHGDVFGISAENVAFDYSKIIERKNAVAKQLSTGIAFLEKSHGVTVFAAAASFKDAHTVALDNGETLECDNLIVATGSEPARIPITGIDLPGVVDSTGLLNMTDCPEHIIIVGGGVSNEGDYLMIPLNKYIAEYCYGNGLIVPPKAVKATLGNDAGIIGAAMLEKSII